MNEAEIANVINNMKEKGVYLEGGYTSDTLWRYYYDKSKNAFVYHYHDEEGEHEKPAEQYEAESILRIHGQKIVRS